MGAASHLGIRLRDYDRAIRSFIPQYDDMLDEAASVLVTLRARAPRIVELGVGAGALAGRCAAIRPEARLVGIDADEGILDMALGRVPGLTTITGDFQSIRWPPCDVVISSFALHHVRTRRRKAALYGRVFRSLARGGLLINADCCLASSVRLQQRDRQAWLNHLEASYSRRRSEAFLETWSVDDVYLTLDDEVRLLRGAGFSVDITWRRNSFAVLMARKPASAARPGRTR